jgi:hypothetical protein
MQQYTKDAVEERTRHWLESNYLAAIANLHDAAHGVYDDDGQPRRLTRYHFQEVQLKLKIFRWLDRLPFSNFIDIGSGFDQYPNLARERYGVPAYYSDFSHSMNLPYGGAEHGKLDHAVTLNIVRLPRTTRRRGHVLRGAGASSTDRRLHRRLLHHAQVSLIEPGGAVGKLLATWLSLRVNVAEPHVERNFFLLPELEAISARRLAS